MSASEIRAGKAFVEVVLKDKIGAGLNQIGAKLKAAGSYVAGIGTGMAGALAPFAAALGDFSELAQGNLLGGVLNMFSKGARTFADVGSALDDMSQRVDIAPSVLSELQYAAKMSGVEAETLEQSLIKMNKAVGAAASGSKPAIAALHDLGLSATEMAAASPEDRLEMIANALARLPSDADRANAAMTIFGKSGAKMVPLLKNGASAIQDFAAQARNLGVAISDEDASKAAELGDRMDQLGLIMRSVLFQAGAAVADVLLEVAETIATVARAVANWIKENRPLIATIARVVLAVGALGAGLMAVGGILFGLGTAFSVAATVIGALTTAAMTAAGAIAALFAAIMTPVGAVAAAVIAAVGAFIYFSGTGSAALEWMSDTLAQWKDTALGVFQGVADALAAGDLALAGRIAWAGLALEWQRGVNALTEIWIGFKNAFWSTVGAVTDWFRKAWSDAVGFVAKLLARIWGFFDRSLDVEAVVSNIDEDTQRQKKEVDDERKKKDAARQDKVAADMRASQQKVRDAQAELDKLRKKAADDAAKNRADFKAPERKLPPPPGPQLEAAVGASLGTFSARAAGMLGRASPGGAAERTAKATEALVDETENTNELLAKVESNTSRIARVT